MKISVLLIASFSLASCRDFLSVQPQGKVLPKTDEEFRALIDARLRDIEGGADEYIVGNMDVIARLEGCADDLDANIMAGSNLPVYAGALINKRQTDWREIWKIVRDCNIVIANLKSRTSTLASKTLSAAYAIKAVCYYNMTRDFCPAWNDGSEIGLPIVETFDAFDRPARASLRETRDYALSLFDAALALEPSDSEFIFTEYVIKAYKAKLLFWTENWGETLLLCDDIIQNSSFELADEDSYAAEFSSAGQGGKETIVRSHINDSGELDWYFSALRGYIASRPASASLIKLYGDHPENDVRHGLCFDPRRFNLKAPECRIRLSEIYLMKAEVLCHLGREAEALEAINYLRDKRLRSYEALSLSSLPPLRTDGIVVYDATGKGLTPLLQLIFDERRKELFMEGDRWFELKRNGSPEWWVISSGLKYTTRKYMYTAPIYRGDVRLNLELAQNEGYEAD